MSNTTATLLRQATASTFESLAFLFVEEECSEEQHAVPLDASVSVEFRGPMRGRVVLRVAAALLPTIASNMLGEDESQHVPLQRDALGEVANVVCGNLLPMLAGADAVFHLEAPQWRTANTPVAADARSGDEPVASVELGVEEGRAVAELFVFSGRELLSKHSPVAGVA